MRQALLALLLLLAPASGWSLAKPSYAHYLKALLLQRQGLYDEALREYQAAATIDPEAPYILEQAAELALDIGQTELAGEFSASLIKLEPKNPKGRHLMGNIKWAAGDAAGAKAEFEEALKLDPAYPDTLYALGNLLSGSDPDAAKKYFLRYLDQSPESAADVQYHVGLLDHRQGRDEEALKRLKDAIRQDPDYLQARYSLAQLYENMKDTVSAEIQYKSLLPLDSQNVGLLVRLGELSFQKGDKEEAESYFKRGVAVESGHPAARFWLAFMAEERGDFAAAADQLSKSSALAEDSGLNLRLSYYDTQAGRLKEGVEVLTAARARWPDDPEIAYFLALGLDDIGQTEKAIAAMKDVARLKPDSREARFQLGVWNEKLNRIEEAEKEFRALLDKRPDDAVSLNYLGYSLADRGLKLADAEKLIRRALAVDPDNGAYLDSLAWVHFKQLRFDEAYDEIQKALVSASDDESVWDHVGEIQWARGKKAEAWSAWMLSSYYGGGAKAAPKLERAAAALSASQLGGLYLKYFERTHGLDKLDALAKVRGSVAGTKLDFSALLHCSREEAKLKLDILGPFFFPLWSLTRDERGPDLGGLEVPGLKPEDLEAAGSELLNLLYAYLQGGVFKSTQAKLGKGWSKSYVETDGYSLFFDKATSRLTSVKAKNGRVSLELGELTPAGGRLVPGRLELKGTGFSVAIELQKPVAEAPTAK